MALSEGLCYDILCLIYKYKSALIYFKRKCPHFKMKTKNRDSIGVTSEFWKMRNPKSNVIKIFFLSTHQPFNLSRFARRTN